MFYDLIKKFFVYGLATTLPRVFTLLLTPFYIHYLPSEATYGIFSAISVYLIFGNVLLAGGMETTFFRFSNLSKYKKEDTISTSFFAILGVALLFLFLALSYADLISQLIQFPILYINLMVMLLFSDAIAVIPLAMLRNEGKSLLFTFIKIINVVVNLSANIFLFAFLPNLELGGEGLKNVLYNQDPINYILYSYFLASMITNLTLLPWILTKIKWRFNWHLYRKMIPYAFPVLVSGIAFSINEGLDKLLLKYLLPSSIADKTLGIYAACYKMGVFMSLFITAFKLGVEPFFFQISNDKSPKQKYVLLMDLFVIFGSTIFLAVSLFVDVIKHILIPKPTYWEGLFIVPIILLAYFFLGLYQTLSVWYKVTDRTYYGAYFSLLGAMVTIVFNIALIPLIGYLGSALTTLASYTVMLILSYLRSKKHYKIPYHIKDNLFVIGLAIFFVIIFHGFFDKNIYLGILSLLIYLSIVLFKSRLLLKLIFKRE